MRTLYAVAALVAGLATSLPALVQAAEPITKQEAHDIGMDAYVYFYPLITMDLTRKQLTNVSKAGEPIGHAPPNTFANVAEYPAADFKTVVRPNFDTLYSVAWVDVAKEPMVLSVPDTHGRYYLMPMLDMWTNVFASPGWRTTGIEAGDFAIVPQDWQGQLPEGLVRIEAPTSTVWIIGRTKTDGPADYAAVHEIQAAYKLTPLSQWGKPPQLVIGHVDPGIDMKTPPKKMVDTMSANAYFAYAAELLKTNAPHITDQPILAQMERLGIHVGESFDLAAADPVVQEALANVPEQAQKLMAWKLATLGTNVNGWLMNTDTMGVYGNYYLKRAIVTQLGLGANLAEDAIYPVNLADQEGRPLNGENKYSIHFDAATMPPVNAFWSITMYDRAGYQIANSLNRFAVSSWMPFKRNPDGSLDLFFQHESPGAELETNWLPAPDGPFNLTMRLYGPKLDALSGKWAPPHVAKVEELPTLQAQ